MAKIGDMTWEEFKAQMNGGNAPPPSPSNLGVNGVNLKEVAESAVQATSGLIGVGKTGAEAATVLGTFAGKIPGIGSGLASFVGSVEEARQANLKNANAGLATGVMYGEINYKTQALGLTQEAFRGLLQNSGGSLNSLGMTADIGAKRLLDVGLKAQDLGKEFIINGNVSQDQLARTTALAQYGSRVTLDNAKAQADAAESSIALAKEIDSVVKVTGRSRDSITGELEERLKSPVLQSALNMATEEQRKGIIQSQAQLAGMGKGVSDLSATLAINGRLTKDQQMQLQTLGPAAGEFQRASRMAALAQTENERKQAADAMASARAKISEYQASQQFATAMKNSTPEVSQYYQRAYQENQERGRVQAAMRETKTDAVSSREQSAMLAGRDQEGIDAKGNNLAERELGKRAQEGQLNASIQAAGTGKAFSDMNIEIGKSPAVLAKLDTGIKTIFGPGGTVEEAAERQKGAVKKIFDSISGPSSSADATASTTAATERLPKLPVTETSRDGRAFGSKEATGGWFEDFGAEKLMKLHGPEAVVPQNKIGEFMSDMMAKLPKPTSQEQGSGPSMPSAPSSSPMQGQSMDSKTMNDLHKQLVDLNTSIKEQAKIMQNVVDHTASTAKYSKAATGNRNA